MKNFSLILNGILAIAIAILFYQVSTLKNAGTSTETSSSDKVIKPVIIESATNLVDAKIAYVNTDSINEHYDYIADFTKVIRGKKATLEAQMQSMTAKFQQEYEAFQQSAQAGVAPQSELQKQQTSLERQQKELANKELQLQNLGVELEEKNLELNKSVKDYLLKINNGRFDYILSYSDMMPTILLANPKLDITSEVLKGINDEYKSKKGKK
ncbi:MAG: OmpH family outer membrane protein [Bacteroidia bacterium]|jgi:outer membrane protein|nr:OmpH family outer membrane protein [Bacteroidia bacterium]